MSSSPRKIASELAPAIRRRLSLLDAAGPGQGEARPGSPGVRGDVTRLDAETRRSRASWRVALVTMPFVSMTRPSIQLGLLKAIGESHGFPVTTHHLNLDFAVQVSPTVYEHLCRHRGRLVGEWLFSLAAFGDRAPDLEDRFLVDLLPGAGGEPAGSPESPERLRALRHEAVPRYLDHLIDAIAWGDFRAVGFTSTFQQNTASFALARRIKERHPGVTLIFGGSNFEGDMGVELCRSVECIDYAVCGEGDLAFPELLIALHEGRDPAGIPGVACRRRGEVASPRPRPPLEQLDELPVPDYGEYFERAEALGLLPSAGRRVVDIPFESARGCWWGEKHHCTFCGLNGSTMAFRAKSPERVAKELAELARRYRSFQFEAVDNIVSTSYLKTLFTRLADERTDYQFFYEVKSNLTREQLKTLGGAGVRRIQPGIESLSSHVLKLMRKGVTGIQNVNTMRWSRYHGISVGWNLIWGFPGETAEDYREQAELIARLTHLEPPGGAGPIWMERFSPIYADRASFPAAYVRPEKSYAYVYPRHIELDKVAYFFDYQLENTLDASAYTGLSRAVAGWIEAWKRAPRPSLTYWSSPELLQIEDLRDPASFGTYTFEEPLASLYLAASERPLAVESIAAKAGISAPAGEVEAALDEFCARGLMMREGRSFLALALPASPGR
ncbi:RiPP maturation radical SAM C-methyltransferase [Sorangium sp. So ce1099]